MPKSRRFRQETKVLSRERSRFPCNCEATIHSLLGNCLSCGRIICSEQGPGPCFTCNETFENGTVINEGMTATKRSNPMKVVDDQGDHFNADNRWLSQDQREKLQELQAEQAKKLQNPVYCIDIEGRKITTAPLNDDDNNEMLRKIESIFSSDIRSNDNYSHAENVQKAVKGLVLKSAESHHNAKSKPLSVRLLDAHVVPKVETAKCLSVHQPFATLLVTGIKKEEYRSWYCEHRGRLWIHASASHRPCASEIAMAEADFGISKDSLCAPNQYAIGCVVGSVNVVDCTPVQEDENSEHYKFAIVCEEPIEVKSLKLPVNPSGPRIFNLDDHVFKALLNLIDE